MTTPLETSEQYYGQQANYEYMSASQLKHFIGTPGIQACEERAVAELSGLYRRPDSNALTIGGYVDVMLTGTEEEQDEFRESHPEMFSSRGPTKGQLKADFRSVNDMVARALGRIDVLGDGFITDLKTVENVNKRYWNDGHWDFVSWWGYDLQGAIYQELVYQSTGERLPFFIAALSKQVPCDIDLIQVPQDRLDEAMERVTPAALDRIEALKNGEERPNRCGRCDWCRMTKVIRKPRILEVV